MHPTKNSITPYVCLQLIIILYALQVTRHKLVTLVEENKYVHIESEGYINTSVQPGWHFDRIDLHTLPLDHKYTASQYTSKSVDVHVLDTSIHYNHSVFNGRAHYPGCHPIDKLEHETREGEDCNGHGTHVAGLVGRNGTGLATRCDFVFCQSSKLFRPCF